jgi:HK97 family phage prohead protease
MSEELELREVAIEEVDIEKREIAGRAVPYQVSAHVANGDYEEIIERGAVVPNDEVLLKWRHGDVIGRVTSTEDKEDGLYVRAYMDESQLGNAAYDLVREGHINKFSIGFKPMEARKEDRTVVRTKIRLNEVSIVPVPVYKDAEILEVREEPQSSKEEQVMTDVVTSADLEEVREEVKREIRAAVAVKEAPADVRSGGEVLKAVIKGQEELREAYAGGTSADTVMQKGWVGDLTRIVSEAAPLRGVFGTDSLPSEGKFIEFAELDSNSIVVEEVDEGEDLPFGKVAMKTRTAPVRLFGSYTQLTRDLIERSSIQYLNRALEAQAKAMGKAISAVVRADYTALVTAQAANKVTVAENKYGAWVDAMLDAKVKLDAQNLDIDALIVGLNTYKGLSTIVDADGLPIFRAENGVGNFNIKGLSGVVNGVPVVLDLKLAAGKDAFVNAGAIKLYAGSIINLQDENIRNLSKDFALAQRVAIADEIPTGVVPVEVA